MTTPDARGEREIVELHRFFQDWYRGDIAESAFSRFTEVMDEDFSIVLPDGRMLTRAAILEAVRGQYASDSQATLEIRDVELQNQSGNTLIMTYEEWQGRGGKAFDGRLSTVVFAVDESRPNGLLWLHVHETWLPDQP